MWDERASWRLKRNNAGNFLLKLSYSENSPTTHLEECSPPTWLIFLLLVFKRFLYVLACTVLCKIIKITNNTIIHPIINKDGNYSPASVKKFIKVKLPKALSVIIAALNDWIKTRTYAGVSGKYCFIKSWKPRLYYVNFLVFMHDLMSLQFYTCSEAFQKHFPYIIHYALWLINAVERRDNQKEVPRHLCFYFKQTQLLTLSLIVSIVPCLLSLYFLILYRHTLVNYEVVRLFWTNRNVFRLWNRCSHTCVDQNIN